VRADLEPRLGHSLESIRVHADGDAAARAERRGAVAFTAGRHIYFGAGAYRPGTPAGDWVLGHEATHAVQQGLVDVAEDGLSDVADPVGENEAHRVAWGQSAQIGAVHAPAAMALTPAQFKAQLGSTPQQALAIDTLFSNPVYLAIWNWLAGCTATPAQDLGPLALRVTPGLISGGVVRFGGYSPFSRTLEINPTKPEHVDNPAELVDTVFHELIHAAHDLDSACQAAGAAAAPLAGAATSTLPSRASVASTPTATVFNILQGPGASDPCGEFIDINAAAQSMVTSAIQANIQATGVGRPTLTFVNMIIRSDPAALASYETCRRTACALSGSARTAALGACSSETIAQFLPVSMLPALLPAHLHFDTAATAVRADEIGKLDAVARFLVHHPAQTVEIVGHADSVGSASSNLTLGQQRADAVKAELLSRGVAASQIRGTPTSKGETSPISTSSSERWRDRRVEILP
jgi:outer membrane protein OmpA-like peptidoglycan-associated protein